jgi:hypothetical protein
MEYTLKRSARAKHLRISVQPGGAIVVTAPVSSREATIESFLHKSASWVERAVARMSRYKALPVSGRRAYLKHKEQSRTFITERVEYWNQFYQFSYGRISIKDTRRCWGSCSAKGNLNFSYALLFLPQELADYVVVHELCHLKEHNHSRAFWGLVEQAQPNYKALRRQLRTYTTG